MFTSDPAIIELGTVRIRMLLEFEFINVFMDNLSGAMRGLGRSLTPALTTLICVCGVRILWVFTGFRRIHTWLSLMAIFPASWAVNASIIIIMYLRTQKELLPVGKQ